MNKTEYIEKLRALLDGCPKEEAERFLAYYSEMIEDRMEDGCPEEEACLSFGSVEEVAAQIRSEILFSEDTSGETAMPPSGNASENTEKEEPATIIEQPDTASGSSAQVDSAKKDSDKKSVSVLLVILAIIGFPLWFPLCIAAFAILLSVLICLWSVVLSFWCVFVSLAAVAVAELPASILLLIYEGIGGFLIGFGSAFICTALAIVFLWLSVLITKGSAKLTALIFKGLWRLLVRK